MKFYNWTLEKEKIQIQRLIEKIEEKTKYIISYWVFLGIILTIIVIYLNFYIFENLFFRQDNLDLFIFSLTFIVFISFFWIQFAFYLKEKSKLSKRISLLKITIKEKEKWILNYEKLLPIINKSLSLKYKINILEDKIWENIFNKNINSLVKELEIQLLYKETEKSDISNYNNFLLMIIFDWKKNWYNTWTILTYIEKEKLKSLLFYVTRVLKYNLIDTWEIEGDLKNNELFFISLKKAIEKQLNHVYKINKNKNNQTKSNIKINKSLYIDFDDNNI